MPTRLNPYLTFPGTAREAMETYARIFGGELHMNTFGEYGGAPEGASADGIMHAMLTTDGGLTLMGADGPGMAHPPATDISVSLSGEDAGELHGYWDALVEGGTVAVPLEKQMWGDEFGMCTDRFGVQWMVNISPAQE